MNVGLSGDRRTTVEAAVRGFLCDRELTCAPRTLGFYNHKLGQFAAFLLAAGVSRLSEVGPEHFRAYLEEARARGNNPGGLHAQARAVKAFLRWAVTEDLLSPRVTAKLKMPRVPRAAVGTFTLEQLEQLLAAALRDRQPERDAAIVLVLFDTGIRAAELCGIRTGDVAGDRVLVHGKGGRDRWVRVSPRTKKALWKWETRRGDSEWLFPSRTGDQLTPGALLLLFRRLKRTAGIEGVRCSPHTARHTMAVEWIRDGGGVFELQKLLGHTTLAMTNRYVNLCDEDVARAHKGHSLVEKLSRRKR